MAFSQRQDGIYSQRQQALVAAYVIFCHGGFENFIEGWADDLITHGETRWKNGNRPSWILHHLCSFGGERNAPRSLVAKDIWSQHTMQRIIDYRSLIKNNNGIKEKNLCSIFAPLGFNVSSLDSVFVAELNTFGTIRGDFAHGSLRNSIGKLRDPFEERKRVDNIVQLLEDFDAQMTEFVKIS